LDLLRVPESQLFAVIAHPSRHPVQHPKLESRTSKREIQLRIATRVFSLFLAFGFPVAVGLASSNAISQADQNAQVIEVTAKKYEWNPSPIRVKLGKVQLKISTLDRAHGFKISLYPDGTPTTGDPGLVFASKEDCFKIDKDSPAVVEFVARTRGTYSFKCCTHCGLGHGGMKGQLVVEP
jgi:heme/copper-type cytochrome/quinol oxidase subunit 2